MKRYSSVKIAIGFLVLVLGTYFGWQLVSARLIDGKVFPEIPPGRVTLVGIKTAAGYRIVVSNKVAQLVQANGDFEAGDMSEDTGGSDSSDKRRIPLKETLQSLQGDAKALGYLVTAMNDDLHKAQQDIPPNPVIWRAEDVQKALDGDETFRRKLEHDTNVKLDGTPADFININALYNGIVLQIPVPVEVSVAGVQKRIVAEVEMPFRAAFTKRVERTLMNKGLNPSDELTRGYYLEEVQRLKAHPDDRENIANLLRDRLNPQTIAQYAWGAEQVLSNAKIVLNENFVEDAHRNDKETNQGKKFYDLDLDLTEEGRERLWQYSRHKVGTQLLLIVDGVAIAAPRVQHELAQSTITITQMEDPDLVDDAVTAIKDSRKAITEKK